VLGVDKIADIALLRIPGSQFQHLESKDSRSNLKHGDAINVIGYPLGYDIQSITRGIVRDNKFQDANVPESVFTDASIFGGNSGGPVIADDGKAVGILSYGLVNTENMKGAVASHIYQPIAEYFADNFTSAPVSYPKGYLGINYRSIDPFDPMFYGGNLKTEGYRIQNFDPTISRTFNFGDIITEVESTRVGMLNNQFPLFTEIHMRPPGTTVNMKYRPYISSSVSYGAETATTVTLSPFNPANDVFLSSIVRHPYTPRD
jgi:S1-C subfamily serine protease